jgi:hypothetical protein
VARVTTLAKRGREPDGLDDDGRPLWDAIKSGYTLAAERLIRRAARVDNL